MKNQDWAGRLLKAEGLHEIFALMREHHSCKGLGPKNWERVVEEAERRKNEEGIQIDAAQVETRT